ncbi:hypothetical protein ACRRTK_014309 [Alexandromys fortis]
MYFFLHILSALEICSTSVTIPLLLHHLLTGRCHIPCSGCTLQMFFFLCFGANECCLLGLRDSSRQVLRIDGVQTKELYVPMEIANCGL